MDAEQYMHAVQQRIVNGGYTAGADTLPDGAALLGRRSDFRWSWMATRLNVIVAVRCVPAVTRDMSLGFAVEALDYGKRAKGRFRGLQTAVAVIAALVSAQVDDAARDFARHDLVRHFAAFAWPVVVDLATEEVVSHEGTPKIGAVYNGWMREQIAAVLPAPSRL